MLKKFGNIDPVPPVTRDEVPRHSADGQNPQLFNLPAGDAATSFTNGLSYPIFYQMIPNVIGARRTTFFPPNFTKFQIVDYQTSNKRYKYFHVGLYGRSITRHAGAGTLGPVTANVAELRASPVVTSLQGYIEVTDASGGREYRIDVIGKRSVEVYGWSVRAGFILPINSYVVNPNLDIATLTQFDGLVSTDVISAGITPIVVNGTQVPDRSTLSQVIPDLSNGFFPIPEGASTVTVYYPTGFTGTSEFTIQAPGVPDATAYDPTISEIPIVAGGFVEVSVPNSSFVKVRNTSGAPVLIVVTFNIED